MRQNLPVRSISLFPLLTIELAYFPDTNARTDASPSASTLNRWLLGTAAARSATLAQANVVQIDLFGNSASENGVSLTDDSYGDLTGDGVEEFTGSELSFTLAIKADSGIGGKVGSAQVSAQFLHSSSTNVYYGALIDGVQSATDDTPVRAQCFIPFTFNAARSAQGRTSPLPRRRFSINARACRFLPSPLIPLRQPRSRLVKSSPSSRAFLVAELR